MIERKYYNKTSPNEATLEKEQANFNIQLLNSLKSEPVEEGYTHPAEEIIEKALHSSEPLAQGWLEEFYDAAAISQPLIAADTLKIIGRLEFGLAQPWGNAIALRALNHPNVHVRDAAVQALELWGGITSRKILEQHLKKEKETWLVEYIKQVITDLAE